MLVIRRSQMAVFGHSSMDRFERALLQHLGATWPREFQLIGSDKGRLHTVRQIIRAAQTQGYDTSRQMSLYATLVVSLGIGFDEDPQFDWASTALHNGAIDDATARIEALARLTIAYLGAVGGEDSEIVVRALLRVRAYDFADAPTSSDEALAEDLCALMGRFWPEKLAFQEPSPTLAMIEYALAKAARHGLDSPMGRCVFVTLSFFLGHAFDLDPMHPWASKVLAEAGRGGTDALANALLGAGLDRLARSLDRI